MHKTTDQSDPKSKGMKRTGSLEMFETSPRIQRPLVNASTSPLKSHDKHSSSSVRPMIFRDGESKALVVRVSSDDLFSPYSSPRGEGSFYSTDSSTFGRLDCSPLNTPSNRKHSTPTKNRHFELPPISPLANDIKAWIIPYKFGETSESVRAYLTKLRSNYYDRIYAVSTKLKIHIAIRVQNDPYLPSNRRYSLLDPNSGKMIATGKQPPLRSKTNATNLLLGHIARRSELQEKMANPVDNSVPGAWLNAIKDNIPDQQLTEFVKAEVSNQIIHAKYWYNLVCWEEKIPEYAQIGDEFIEKGTMAEKYYIQEAVHIYWLIKKIANKDGPRAESGRYDFVSGSNQELLFKFNNELFKIKLNTLMPPFKFKKTTLQQFTTLEQFSNYVDELGIKLHHAPLFCCNKRGMFVPEMVWCGPDGHITGDADPQHFGKRFDMPRIAYAIFWGEEPSDHEKFINGLVLLKKRLQCATQQEFIHYVNTCTYPVHEYISDEELNAADEYYITYMDKTNAERYDYYQNIFMPMLQKTIDKYTLAAAELAVVCHSDLYSLIIQMEIAHDLSIHAPEDTNQHAGDIGATLCCNEELLYLTENEVSLLAGLLHDRKLLAQQVIGVNPYYLRNRTKDHEISLLWLDTIKIRCLNAALISDFEFRMHWQNIVRIFFHDKKYGQDAIMKVNDSLTGITKLLGNKTAIMEELNIIYAHALFITEEFSAKLEISRIPSPESATLVYDSTDRPPVTKMHTPSFIL